MKVLVCGWIEEKHPWLVSGTRHNAINGRVDFTHLRRSCRDSPPSFNLKTHKSTYNDSYLRPYATPKQAPSPKCYNLSATHPTATHDSTQIIFHLVTTTHPSHITMDLFSPTRPIRSLTALFISWKTFLLAIALGAAIAPDYDTSTSLFFERMYGSNITIPIIASRLTRWDGLYFMHSTIKGYIYEQEWAFGLGLPTTVGAISRSLSAITPANYALEPLVAICLAHASHFIAVLSLHRLTMLLSGNAKLAFISSALHILSPAGLFLSAPYNESPFAGLSFVGNLLFAIGLKSKPDRIKRDAAMIAAGIFFGLATTFRSNGLTSGLLFAVEAGSSLLMFAQSPSLCNLLSLVAPVLGGLCVAAGSVVPQTLAWVRYCGADSVGRPWCEKLIPSIYSFVQDHYWYVFWCCCRRYWLILTMVVGMWDS